MYKIIIDKSEVTLLTLFDVSAAFDTVDHQILLQRPSISFALSGNILGWLTSHLRDRCIMVAREAIRNPRKLKVNVKVWRLADSRP